jgi:hypothetical protein
MLPRKELETLALACGATKMTTEMLYRHCIRIRIIHNESLRKRDSVTMNNQDIYNRIDRQKYTPSGWP